MNSGLRKFLTITLTLMFALSPIIFQQNVEAQARPKIYVSPAENIFHTDTTPVGTQFTVSVMAADWAAPGVFSYEFKLSYDNTMLEAVAAEIPVGHWLTPTIKPGNIFIVDGGTINHPQGYVSFAATLLSPEEGKTGAGTIAKVTLKITAAPALGKTLASTIKLIDVILVDPAAVEIPKANYDVVPATYQYISPPPPKPVLKVSSHAWDDKAADAAGRVFNITVTINGLAADLHVVGIEFFLEFNAALLESKKEWIYEGDFFKKFGETFFVAYVEPPNVIVGQLQLPPYPGPQGWANGSGVIATIQFYATYRPPPPASCNLTLTRVLLVDAEAHLVEYERLEHGRYTITVAPPPWLSVTPKDVPVEKLGDSFNLNVAINELDKGFRMVGVEFKVRYDITMLETKDEWITEGDFMKDFATRAGTDTFFQAYVEEDYGLVGIIILPLPNGTWPFNVFPEGTGVLSALRFRSLFQHETEDITTYLQVFDVLLVDVDAKEIPVNLEKTAVEGKCTCTLLKAYVPPVPPFAPPPHPEYPYSIDLYTQYSSPYGGQGYNRISDAFAPQAEVSLRAKVTFYDDPVSGKPVTYQIRGKGGVEYSAVRVTDAEGIAELKYIMPFSEANFGLWEASASWQIGEKVVSDTLKFRVGWLVLVESMQLEEWKYIKEGLPVYYKGETYPLFMSLSIITLQDPDACLVGLGAYADVAIFDELGQPVSYSRLPTAIPEYIKIITDDDDKKAQDFVLKERTRPHYVGLMSVTIAPAAFTGNASIQGNVFALEGTLFVPYGKPKIKHIWIEKETRPVAIIMKPVLKVSSKIWDNKTATEAKGLFNISITIQDVLPDLHIVGIQFRIEFDTTLLKVKNVFEGDFVKQFGPTYLTWYIEDGALVGILQLPPWPGPKGWMEGSGTVAIIEFEAIRYSPSPWPLACRLTLKDAFMADEQATRIEFRSLEHGYYTITS